MNDAQLKAVIAALPKAELHLHLEGSIEPETVVELAARHGFSLTREEAAARYVYPDFMGFLDAFKWVTSFLRTPSDYALITDRLADQLLAQNALYAEVTLSVGVMLWRKQDAEANLAAIAEAGGRALRKGLRLQWIPDATRQFGPAAAMEVARLAAQMKSAGAVAFGMGGDELAVPTADFLPIYDYVAAQGLHRLIHAGEVGGPELIRDAVNLLGAERIGHGIAAMHDPRLRESLRVLCVSLELCPTSNLRTGALARQLGRPEARMEDHPVRKFFEEGMLLTISTDDPAMFSTSLNEELSQLRRLGFTLKELAALCEQAAGLSFLPQMEKAKLLLDFRRRIESLNLV